MDHEEYKRRFADDSSPGWTWMLDHPSLKDVYPALKAESGAPILEEISHVLAPRFGEDLFA